MRTGFLVLIRTSPFYMERHLARRILPSKKRIGEVAVRSNRELAATIRAAMKRKVLTDKTLGKVLGVSTVMVDKIICGDVLRRATWRSN